MKTMLKRFRNNEEGLDLVQLLIAVVILGFLIGIAALVLIGKVQSAKENSANASIANAVTATKAVLSEGSRDAQGGNPAVAVNDAGSVIEAVKRALGGVSSTDKLKIVGTGTGPITGPIYIMHEDGDDVRITLDGRVFNN